MATPEAKEGRKPIQTQLYPELNEATEAALRLSIQRFGVLVPVYVDQHGDTIDGHHRRRLAEELGVECPTIVREVGNEAERFELARTLNEDRRMLTREQRLPMVKLLNEDGHSQQAISEALGVSKRTIEKDRRALASMGVTVQKTRLRGSNQPSRKASDDEKARRRKKVAALRERGQSFPAIAGAVGVSRQQAERDYKAFVAEQATKGKTDPVRASNKVQETREKELHYSYSLFLEGVFRLRKHLRAGWEFDQKPPTYWDRVDDTIDMLKAATEREVRESDKKGPKQ